ncbi:NRDE family protein [Pontibacter sp. G13]|uniref:NRDE family protein n=1 Tax=Pontibacter sp. G13 TaxID=3074898 RepID=UPI00288B295F|nr:NRDE family protein [Pontibacter sp. G13]WNJ19372.1 NRDE family protein [Pontibacter sp. G13]
MILFAKDVHPDYPLILAANRDEFYARPTARLDWWKDHPEVLAGRDLKAGGTWMGLSRSGRFSALTNFRDPSNIKEDAPSRGDLVSDFLKGHQSPAEYLAEVETNMKAFNGFNLLVGDQHELWWVSNEADQGKQQLSPGIYGLSNAILDTPWPKVLRGKAALAEIVGQSGKISPEPLFSMLKDPTIAPDSDLPQTGVPLEWERKLSAMYIAYPDSGYGTRVSTVCWVDRSGNWFVEERAYVPAGEPKSFRLEVSAQLDS